MTENKVSIVPTDRGERGGCLLLESEAVDCSLDPGEIGGVLIETARRIRELGGPVHSWVYEVHRDASLPRAFTTCFMNRFATLPATVPPSELNLPLATTIFVSLCIAV